MDIESFLDRFGLSNKFRKKSKKEIYGNPTDDPTSSLRRTFKFVYQTSWECPGDVPNQPPRDNPWTSDSNIPGRHFKTSLGRQFRTSMGWLNRIFRGCPGDVGGRRFPDILRTNICWLGRVIRLGIKWWKNYYVLSSPTQFLGKSNIRKSKGKVTQKKF